MIRTVVVTLLAGVIASACSAELDRETVFRDYIDAVNRNAVEEALALHTPDAEFLIPGQNLIVGTDAMRALLQWDSVLESSLAFGDIEALGDTLLVGPGSERNLWFAGIGLDSIAYAAGLRVVFEGPLIRGVYPGALIPESAAEFEAKIGQFMAWASTEPETDLPSLMPEGRFRYDAEAASRWLGVLARYGLEG